MYVGLTSVRQFLRQSVERRLTQLGTQLHRFPGQHREIQWLQSVMARLDDPALQPQRLNTKPSRPSQDKFQCLHCERSFDTLHGMRTHMASKHGARQSSSAPVSDFRKHSVRGLPICVHCGQSFRKWGGFRGHLQACPVLHAGVPGQLAQPKLSRDVSEQSPQLVGHEAVHGVGGRVDTTASERGNALASEPVASLEGSNAVASEPVAAVSTVAAADEPYAQRADKLEACKRNWLSFAEKKGPHLSQHCAVCGQWCAQSAGMKSHIRRSHPEIWAHNAAIMDTLKSEPRIKYKGRCRACGFQPSGAQAGALRTPKCIAYYQSRLMLQQFCPGTTSSAPVGLSFSHRRPENDGGPDAGRPKRRRRCSSSTRAWRRRPP